MIPAKSPRPSRPIDDRLLDALAAADEALDQFEPAAGTDALEILAARLELVRRMVPSLSVPSEATEAAGAIAHPVRIGRYEILGEMGVGGSGIVFHAYDPILRRDLALKVPRPDLLLTPELRTRFLREARAAGSLDHPGIVPVLDAGEIGTICYIATVLCDGPDLAQWLKDQIEPVAFATAAEIAMIVADAVQHAHDRGILHRDIKPSNILMFTDTSGKEHRLSPRLTDFSLARIQEDQHQQISVSGLPIGSPLYMSPEQAAGPRDRVGPATDIYAVGVLLYELVTGRPPFQGESVVDTLRHVLEHEPPSPRWIRPGLPIDLETIILRCLRKSPERRYASSSDLRDDLARFLEGKPIHARPRPWWEKSWVWSARHPRLAGSITLTGLAAIGVMLGILTTNARLVRLNSDLAKQTERADRFSYDSNLQLASQAIRDSQFGRAQHLLRVAGDHAELKEFTWHYLWSLSRAEGLILGELDNGGRSTRVSHNYRFLAITDAERGLSLFDLREGRLIWSIKFEKPGVPYTTGLSLAFSSDDSKLAIGWLEPNDIPQGESSFLQIRDTDDGGLLWQSPELKRTMIRSVAFLGNENSLVTHETWPWRDAPARVGRWDFAQGGKQWRVQRQESFESSTPLGLSPDGAYFVSSDSSKNSFVYDARTLARLHQLAQGSFITDRSPTFDAIGRHVSLMDQQARRIGVWQLDSGSLVGTVENLPPTVERYLVGSGGQGIVLVKSDQSLLRHDLKSHEEHQIIEASSDPDHEKITHLSYSPDEKALVINRCASLKPNRIEVRSLVDGGLIAAPSFRQLGSIDSWAVISQSMEGPLLVYSLGRSVWLWKWERTAPTPPQLAHSAEAWGIAFSPDGSRLASCGDDTSELQTVRIWNAAKGSQERGWKAHSATVTDLCFSPDGSRLATTSLDSKDPVRVWAVETGTLIESLPSAEKRGCRSVSWSSNGRWIAAGGTSGLLSIWDGDNRTLIREIQAHKDRIQSIAFSPDDRFIATVGDDAYLKLWSMPSGKPLGSMRFLSELYSVVFHPTGRMLAICGREGWVKLIDPSGMETIRTIRSEDPENHALAFSPDGRTIASGGVLQCVQLWDTETGQELSKLPKLSAQINGLSFSPDGQSLVSCDHTGHLQIWRGPQD